MAFSDSPLHLTGQQWEKMLIEGNVPVSPDNASSVTLR